MSQSSAPKIISINATSPERSPGLRILNSCREDLSDALCRWLSGIRPSISEELFLLADGTSERLLQTRYLDLRQEVEKEWTQFIEAFRHNFEAPRNGAAGKEGDVALEIQDFDGLQLIEDSTLSENIVIREFSAKLDETCDEELYPLERRIAALLGRMELRDDENPLSTSHVCQALADACAALGLGAESRLLLLRRIDRHLHLALPPMYHEINADLIERGILSDLKRSYRRSDLQGGQRPQVPGTAPAATQVTTTSATPLAAALQNAGEIIPVAAGDLLGMMQRIVSARYPDAPPATAAAQQAGAAPVDAAAISHAFLESLNEAQQHTPWVPGATMAVNQVRQVRESAAAQQVSPLESVTIDIVAMLFDFIFNDDELPATVKSLVGQLQIPVLKVAMLDHRFFANRQHPARCFLDGITGIALHWGVGNSEDDPFHARLAAAVGRIQSQFETNVEIFSETLQELEAFVTDREAESAATVNVAAEAVARRESEETARDMARTAMRSVLEKPMPAVVHNFLEEHWSALLQQTALTHASDSPVWQETLDVAEQLVWSVAAKTEADERLRLISALPMLLARINVGLNKLGVSQEARNTFFDALVELHAAALKGLSAQAEAAQTASPAAADTKPDTGKAADEGDLLVTRRVEEGVVIEEVMLVGAPQMRRARDREAMEEVNELKRGDWVDFTDANGHMARERLNWISPQKGILVFSNHRAAKAISITPEALARQIRNGTAQVVNSTSVFDKAIDGVMQSLNAA